MKALINRQAEGTYRLQGKLDFDSVPVVLRESETLFAQDDGDLLVDLAEVQRGNSAGLGLLLEWVRLARLQNRTIQFQNIPKDILAIARVTDLDGILPIKH